VGIEVNFEGKIAMVTGASSGLGARFAKALAAAGAQVVLASRRIERLKELRAEIEAEGGAAHVVALDVTDLGSIKSAIAHAETEAGPIDILVNNSGVSTTQRLLDVTEEDYGYIMDTNLRGAFFMAQQTAKRMIQRAKGDPKKQHRIVNIASVAEMNEDYFDTEQGKKLIEMLPRRRAGKPEDLDGLLLLLAAEEAHFINGAIITADDGMTAQ
jgi:NAD(P)-dependent dehydrogenase (short-subunit alcohol dehydrogenase family)